MRLLLLVLVPLLIGALLTAVVLAAVLFVAGSLLLGVTTAAATPRWTPPVEGPPTRLFHLGANPFARGQHRGVDLATNGEQVRAACSGRVVFAGRVAGEGTVSQRCGRWRVSYAPLIRLAVRAGAPAGPGTRLGRAGGELHFGVRREGRRFGYVDPLRFFGAQHAPPPLLAPRGEGRRPGSPRPVALRPHPPPRALAARPHPPPALAPWPVWLGLLLGLTGLLGAGRLRLPSRRQEGAPCRASSTSSSSPTTPSSP
jgi:Peptidase family M23